MVQMLMEEIGAKRVGAHAGGRKQKYVLDEPGRRLMRALYDGKSEHIDQLATRLAVPRAIVKRWASQMGLTRQKERLWTKEDEEYVERNLHRMSLAAIAKKLNRTKVAIKLKAKRLGVNKTQEGFTMVGLCGALGCDHHKIERWMQDGWLEGRRRKSEREKDFWLFTDKNIRDFVITHPLEIDHRRIDWLWMVDLLAGGDYGGIGSLTGVVQ